MLLSELTKIPIFLLTENLWNSLNLIFPENEKFIIKGFITSSFIFQVILFFS